MKFSRDSKILLVGEGNFSFAVSLCVTMEYCSPNQVVATCLENEEHLTKSAKENSKLLRNKGVLVLFSIDGRKLETHFEAVFSFVSFNFPHCGGKMKIHKNRQLLMEFFRSAEKVITSDGAIIITLCSGQGGVPLDTTTRRRDDTWQVVSMAAYANLLLTSIAVFDPSAYHGYSCSGYRSLDKGFHQKGSLLFKFLKSCFIPASISIKPTASCSVDLIDGSSLVVPQYVYKVLQRNIFDEEGSFMKHCFSYVIDILKSSFLVSIKERKVFYSGLDIKLISKECCSKDNELSVYPLLYLNIEKTEVPVSHCCMIIGTASSQSKLITFLSMKFSLEVHNTSKSWTSQWKTFTFSDVCWYPNLKDTDNFKYEYCTEVPAIIVLDLTTFSHNLFDLEGNEFWRKIQTLSRENGMVVYQPHSMFPPVYTYHLSFWLPPLREDHVNHFHYNVKAIIINSLQDTLVKFSLLGSHTNPKYGQSETYEITYCSYDAALSKDRAKSLHQEVGKLLEDNLGCKIR